MQFDSRFLMVVASVTLVVACSRGPEEHPTTHAEDHEQTDRLVLSVEAFAAAGITVAPVSRRVLVQIIGRVGRPHAKAVALYPVQQAPPAHRPAAVHRPHVMRLAPPEKGLGKIVKAGVKHIDRFVDDARLTFHLWPPPSMVYPTSPII